MKSLIDKLKETINRPWESFLDNADHAYQEKKDQDALAEGRQEQEKLEGGEITYEI